MLRKTILSFLTTHGQKAKSDDGNRLQDMLEGHGVKDGIIVDPVEFIAAATGRTPDSVYVWFRKAENGIGIEKDGLDPIMAMAFMWIADRVLVDNDEVLATDHVQESLFAELADFYERSYRKHAKRTGQSLRKSKSRSNKR